MQKSIFAKYFSICAALILVSITTLGAILLVFAAQYFKQDKFDLLDSNVIQAVRVAEQNNVDGVVEKQNIESFYSAISHAIEANIFITDLNGKTLYCTENGDTLCTHLTYSVPQEILEKVSKNVQYEEMGNLAQMYNESYYTVARPIQIENDVNVGYVFASAPASKPLRAFLVEIFQMFLISSVAVLIIAFIVVYFISLQMVKPLRAMSVAAKKFGRGEFDTRLQVSNYDEMGQLAIALNNMAQSLSVSETTRRSFVANVSHELKTPMTSISGFIDGILDGTIPPEQQKHYLTIVSDEVKRLSGLVKTMLNLSKIEAGEMKIDKKNIEIVDIICQALFSLETQIDAKNLDIRGLDAPKTFVMGDNDLIHQVVYNLIENAVKFANFGGYIEFNLTQDANKVYIGVKNSGAGISKEEMPKIFDRFYKTDKSRGLDKNGVGLGLYIVRSIVNLHGGDIMVNSTQGEFCEFVFSLEIAKQNKFKRQPDVK
ncbi:MAG: HAMP domain-containing sensor histidine kinase [Oscillospiraceae bacterium]